MRYVLITPEGRQMIFYILQCAEVYRIILGGEIYPIIEGVRQND